MVDGPMQLDVERSEFTLPTTCSPVYMAYISILRIYISLCKHKHCKKTITSATSRYCKKLPAQAANQVAGNQKNIAFDC